MSYREDKTCTSITNTGEDGAAGHRQITQVRMGPATDQGLIKGDVLREGGRPAKERKK